MIFITDELGKFEKNIIELAENVGFKECKTIEAIDLFCGISEKNDVLKEKDRYYAFIDIPQYWSVRADGLNGAIYDNKTKKANIYFKNPIEKRMVSRVEWIDRNNTVYKVDYYNKYGYMYCSENVSGGNVTVREFYDRNGDIKVLEQTGPKTYTTFGTRISPKSYRGFADYLEAYLKYNKIYDENIWLTSDEILNKFAWDYGNFKISYLPQNRLNSDLTVITRTNTAFRILCSEEQQVNWYKENSNYKCDRVYSYFENNELKFGKKEALTITESDQLEYIEQLINDFPEITFHIAASTIMSDKLTRLDINNNVELYPCITEQKRKELFERCDIYLDINHYRELYNAVNEANIGFLDEEVIWLYTFFTDVRTSPVTFTLKELEATMAEEDYTFSRDGKTCRYQFKESGRFYTCYMVDDTSDLVHRVEIVSNGCLIRKDFYTYCRTFSEYYAPLDGKAHLYGRTFFNEDGSVCYEEVIEDDSTFYRIGAQVLYTKADLVGYMVKRLNLTADDVVIIDRTTGIGQAILENCGPARVGIVVHADHFSEGGTDDDYILWNNYYEYSFSQTEHIDFYITATDAQNELMRQQFKKYCGKEPHVVTIPVGSLDELKYPDEPRKRHSLITASRLATEKHCDWLVEAVVKAKESVPDISLDIYGKGGDEAKLKRLIGRLGCADYVHLMGQQKLDDVYKHYDAYVAASQSEGFGLTLMEAIGSGLPIVGFDVRYGNQTFIDDGQNGYKIPITDEMDQKEKIKLLSERIVRMFTEDDMDAFSGHSYEKAKEYLTKEVVHRWIELLK